MENNQAKTMSFGYYKFGKIILFIALLLVASVFLFYLVSYFLDDGGGIKNIKVSNMSSNSVTISWTTEDPVVGKVYYSDNDNWPPLISRRTKDVAYDDRDFEQNPEGEYILKSSGENKRTTHHVTIKNLDPETEYFFKVGAKYKLFSAEDNRFVTFAVDETLKTPEPAYGRVAHFSDNEKEINDGILYYRIVDAVSGEGTQLYSTTLSDQRTWSTDIGNLKDMSGNEYNIFSVPHNFDIQVISASGNGDGQFPATVYKPTPDIYINVPEYGDENSIIEEENSSNLFSPSNVFASSEISSPSVLGIGDENIIPAASCQEPNSFQWDFGPWQTSDPKLPLDRDTWCLCCEANHGGYRQTCVNQVSHFNQSAPTGSPTGYAGFCEPTFTTNGLTPTDIPEEAATGEFYIGIPVGNECNWLGWKKQCMPNSNIQSEYVANCINSRVDRSYPQPNPNCTTGNEFNSTINPNFNDYDCGGGVFASGPDSCPGATTSSQISPETTTNPTETINFTWQSDANALGYVRVFSVSNGINSDNSYSQLTSQSLEIGTDVNVSEYRVEVGVTDESPILCDVNGVQVHPTQCNTNTEIDFCENYQGTDYALEYFTVQASQLNTDSDYPLQIQCDQPVNIPVEGGQGGNNGAYFTWTTSPDTLGFISVRAFSDSSLIAGPITSDLNSGMVDIPYSVNANEYFVTVSVPNNSPNYCIVTTNSGEAVSNSFLVDPSRCNESPQPTDIDCSDPTIAMLSMNVNQIDTDEGEQSLTPYTLNCTHSRNASEIPPDYDSTFGLENNKFVLESQAQNQTSRILDPGVYDIDTGNTSRRVRVTNGQVELSFFRDDNGDNIKQENEPFVDDINPYNISINQTSEVSQLQINRGWNLIGIELFKEVRNAQSLIQDMRSQGIDALHLRKYDSGWQRYTQREDSEGEVISYEDDGGFTIYPGDAVFVFSKNAGTYSLSGNSYTESVPLNLNQGWNLVSIINPDRDYTAEALLDSCLEQGIGCDSVAGYENNLYKISIKEDGTFFGTDYNINSKDGYFLRVSENGGETFEP